MQKFFCNKEEAKYVVNVYHYDIHKYSMLAVHYYFADYWSAYRYFNHLTHTPYSKDMTISLYDLKKDVCKRFIKL